MGGGSRGRTRQVAMELMRSSSRTVAPNGTHCSHLLFYNGGDIGDNRESARHKGDVLHEVEVSAARPCRIVNDLRMEIFVWLKTDNVEWLRKLCHMRKHDVLVVVKLNELLCDVIQTRKEAEVCAFQRCACQYAG